MLGIPEIIPGKPAARVAYERHKKLSTEGTLKDRQYRDSNLSVKRNNQWVVVPPKVDYVDLQYPAAVEKDHFIIEYKVALMKDGKNIFYNDAYKELSGDRVHDESILKGHSGTNHKLIEKEVVEHVTRDKEGTKIKVTEKKVDNKEEIYWINRANELRKQYYGAPRTKDVPKLAEQDGSDKEIN